jgi:hypothetical protein
MNSSEVFLDHNELEPIDNRLIAAFTNAEIERVFNTRFVDENLTKFVEKRRQALEGKILSIQVDVINLGVRSSQEETEVEQLRREV